MVKWTVFLSMRLCIIILLIKTLRFIWRYGHAIYLDLLLLKLNKASRIMGISHIVTAAKLDDGIF